MQIVGIDNLARETVADRLVVAGIPNTPENRAKAEDVCQWLNTMFCGVDAHGTYHKVIEDDYRFWRGMHELV